MIVTFCGHSSILHVEPVEAWLEETLRGLITEGASVFYLGGYGAFDLLANRVLTRLKEEHPTIEHILILPYLGRDMNESAYTSTIYPALENVPKRLAIVRRNEWMISQADIVVCYVQYISGGASKTLELAQKKKKKIIQYGQT